MHNSKFNRIRPKQWPTFVREKTYYFFPGHSTRTKRCAAARSTNMKLFYTFDGECVSERVFYLNEIFICDRRRIFALYFMRDWGEKEKNPIYSTYVCVHGAFAIAMCVHIINYTPSRCTRGNRGKTWKRKCLLGVFRNYSAEPTVA